MNKQEVILGKLQSGENFGFFIPDNRADYGGDFFVNKKNFCGAQDGDLVKAVEIRSKGKKPEVKIISVKGQRKTLNEITIKGTFSFSSEGNWGYIDLVRVIDGKKIDKGYFVHSKNFKGAKSGDQVKAKLQKHKGKLEAIVVKILDDDREIFLGKYRDNGDFGFVIIENGDDIFIPQKWNNGAKNGDMVKVKIIDKSGRRPVGIIVGERKIIKNTIIDEKHL